MIILISLWWKPCFRFICFSRNSQSLFNNPIYTPITLADFLLLFPAVSTSMPQFHQMMGERLRGVEQGADTVLWLALSKAAARTRSGQFFQGELHQVLLQQSVQSSEVTSDRLFVFADRTPVPAHLPLAWTHSSAEEIQHFMTQLETLARAIQSQPDVELNGPSRPHFVWILIQMLHHM